MRPIVQNQRLTAFNHIYFNVNVNFNCLKSVRWIFCRDRGGFHLPGKLPVVSRRFDREKRGALLHSRSKFATSSIEVQND